jgi:hypothetical protein
VQGPDFFGLLVAYAYTGKSAQGANNFFYVGSMVNILKKAIKYLLC